MAEIPRVYAQPNVPGYRAPRPTPESFGAGFFGELAQQFEKQAREEEALRLETYDVGVQGQLRQAIVTARTKAEAINDPELYQQVYEQELNRVYPDLQAQVEGDAKRGLILARRFNEYIGGESRNIAAGVTARQRDTSLSNLQQSAQFGRERVLEGGNPLEESQRYDLLVNAAPFVMRDEQEKLKAQFRDTISKDFLYEQARKDPLGFAQRVEEGEFKGLSSQYLDEALSIAGRVASAADVRSAKIDKARSDVAENVFTERAKTHQLNEAEFLDAARYYKWDERKIDTILRLQYGVRLSSPYAERLIADALSPVNKVVPTVQDVREANQRLTALSDRIDSHSVEMTQAFNKLRGISEYLARSTGPDREAKRNAGQRLANMVNIYFPDEKRDPDFQSELGRIKETMRTMPSDKLDSYLDKIEALWKIKGQQIQVDKTVDDRLLNLKKK